MGKAQFPVWPELASLGAKRVVLGETNARALFEREAPIRDDACKQIQEDLETVAVVAQAMDSFNITRACGAALGHLASAIRKLFILTNAERQSAHTSAVISLVPVAREMLPPPERDDVDRVVAQADKLARRAFGCMR